MQTRKKFTQVYEKNLAAMALGAVAIVLWVLLKDVKNK
jgi:hypothetical protein